MEQYINNIFSTRALRVSTCCTIIFNIHKVVQNGTVVQYIYVRLNFLYAGYVICVGYFICKKKFKQGLIIYFINHKGLTTLIFCQKFTRCLMWIDNEKHCYPQLCFFACPVASLITFIYIYIYMQKLIQEEELFITKYIATSRSHWG